MIKILETQTELYCGGGTGFLPHPFGSLKKLSFMLL